MTTSLWAEDDWKIILSCESQQYQVCAGHVCEYEEKKGYESIEINTLAKVIIVGDQSLLYKEEGNIFKFSYENSAVLYRYELDKVSGVLDLTETYKDIQGFTNTLYKCTKVDPLF